MISGIFCEIVDLYETIKEILARVADIGRKSHSTPGLAVTAFSFCCIAIQEKSLPHKNYLNTLSVFKVR
jgi:hypothetical protein